MFDYNKLTAPLNSDNVTFVLPKDFRLFKIKLKGGDFKIRIFIPDENNMLFTYVSPATNYRMFVKSCFAYNNYFDTPILNLMEEYDARKEHGKAFEIDECPELKIRTYQSIKARSAYEKIITTITYYFNLISLRVCDIAARFF